MLFNVIYWGGVIVAFLLSVMVGFIIGVKDEANKNTKRYNNMINRAMRDAYNAGFIDGKSKKRNLGADQ